jgi:hypothetical protein
MAGGGTDCRPACQCDRSCRSARPPPPHPGDLRQSRGRAGPGRWAKYTLDVRAAAEEARIARDDAERLLDFMLEDLVERLEPMGQVEILGEVSRQALRHYDATEQQQLVPENRRRRARARGNLGKFSRRWATSAVRCRTSADSATPWPSWWRPIPRGPTGVWIWPRPRCSSARHCRNRGRWTRPCPAIGEGSTMHELRTQSTAPRLATWSGKPARMSAGPCLKRRSSTPPKPRCRRRWSWPGTGAEGDVTDRGVAKQPGSP